MLVLVGVTRPIGGATLDLATHADGVLPLIRAARSGEASAVIPHALGFDDAGSSSGRVEDDPGLVSVAVRVGLDNGVVVAAHQHQIVQ